MSNLSPYMSINEQSLLGRYLEERDHFFEWGSGGSTLLAFKAGVWLATSVESDGDFAAMVASHEVLSTFILTSRLRVVHVDVGKTGNWGTPTEPFQKKKWARYYRWRNLYTGVTPDFFFVDGRFRVRCALEAGLYSSTSTLVAFHDFFSRPHYQEVLDVFEVVDRVDDLCIMARKPGLEDEFLELIAAKYADDFR